jgi:hypothetical protein
MYTFISAFVGTTYMNEIHINARHGTHKFSIDSPDMDGKLLNYIKTAGRLMSDCLLRRTYDAHFALNVTIYIVP